MNIKSIRIHWTELKICKFQQRLEPEMLKGDHVVTTSKRLVKGGDVMIVSVTYDRDYVEAVLRAKILSPLKLNNIEDLIKCLQER